MGLGNVGRSDLHEGLLIRRDTIKYTSYQTSSMSVIGIWSDRARTPELAYLKKSCCTIDPAIWLSLCRLSTLCPTLKFLHLVFPILIIHDDKRSTL